MSAARVDFPQYKITGEAHCIGGKHPDPPLDEFPLLAWCVAHARHGSKVFTEDGAASVEDIALAACESPDYAVLASMFGTTEEHVSQAVGYAVKAGYLGQ